jgi:hypothetical protein
VGYRLLADGVLLLHLAFVGFVVVGSFLAWRWPRLAFWHLPMLAWGIYIELSGGLCPLTPLENALRRLAGQRGFEGGFVEHYLVPLVYPPGLTRDTQWLLAAVLIAVNLIGYTGLWRRRRRGA